MSTVVTVDPLVLAPALLPALAAVVVLVADAVAPARARSWPTLLGVAVLVAAAAAALRPSWVDSPQRSLCLAPPDDTCLWVADATSGALQAGVLLSSAAALALLDRGDRAVTSTLVLAAAAGGAGVAASRDLGTWLVCLELATVPLVALVALRGTRSAAHGALTLLVTSVVSFALLVLGAALWLTATGQPTFSAEAVGAAWADPQRRAVLVLSTTVLLAGLGFKLSLVPFHAWTPQAFSTADTGTAVFLATASKVAATGALIVVVTAFAGRDAAQVTLVLGLLAVASMLLGNVMALRQDDPTRLLAWSTVAQAGWVVLPLTALSASGPRAAAAYVLTYSVATVVAFTAVARVGAGTLAGHRGLVRRDPVAGLALGLALLVLAGLPPAVIGLVAKMLALRPAVEAGLWPLVVVAVLAVVLGIAVYLRWVAVLLARPADAGTDHGGEDRADDGTDAEHLAGGSASGSSGAGPRGRRATTVILVAGGVVLAVLSGLPDLLLGLLS